MAFKRVHGIIETARPVVTHSQIEMRPNVLAVFLQQLLKFSYRLGQVSGVGEPDGTTVAFVFGQPIFGVRTGVGSSREHRPNTRGSGGAKQPPGSPGFCAGRLLTW